MARSWTSSPRTQISRNEKSRVSPSRTSLPVPKARPDIVISLPRDNENRTTRPRYSQMNSPIDEKVEHERLSNPQTNEFYELLAASNENWQVDNQYAFPLIF